MIIHVNRLGAHQFPDVLPCDLRSFMSWQVAVALEDATLRLVDLRLGRPVNTMQGHTKPPLWASQEPRSKNDYGFCRGLVGLSEWQKCWIAYIMICEEFVT